MVEGTIHVSGKISSVGRNIREPSANSVVDTSRGVDIYIQLGVIWVGQVRTMEVRLDMAILIRGAREVVREPACGGEVYC